MNRGDTMKNQLKKLTLFMILLTGVIWVLVGCAQKMPEGQVKQEKDKVESNKQLEALLPEDEGYTWIYNGFAEYGHRMSLEFIEKTEQKTTYHILGKVEDLSDGESKLNPDINLNYIIKEGILTQTKQEEAMLDSDYDTIQLVKTPLEKGNKWLQEVKDQEGNPISLDCEITDIEEKNGRKVYTIVYEDTDSDYYEKRKIEEGTGVVSFEKLWITEELKMPIGYTLYEEKPQDKTTSEATQKRNKFYTKGELMNLLQDGEYNKNITWDSQNEHVIYATYNLGNQTYKVFFSSVYMKGEIAISKELSEMPELGWSNDGKEIMIEQNQDDDSLKRTTIAVEDIDKTVKND